MIWFNHPFVIPLMVTAVISAALSLYAFQRFRVTASHSLGVMMAAVAFWSLAYMFELGSPALETKIFWARFKYLGVQFVPLSWLVFSLRYSGYAHWLTRRNLAWMLVVPVGLLCVIWTSAYYGLYTSAVALDQMGGYSILEITPGPAFWVSVVYNHTQALIGAVFFIRANLKRPGLGRLQLAALIVAILAPWLGNSLFITGLTPVAHLDLTPFAFTLSGALLVLVLSGFRLLDVLPIAHISIFNNLVDAVAIVDASLRVTELNPAAERILGISTAGAAGLPLIEIFSRKIHGFAPELLNAPEVLLRQPFVPQDITIGEGKDQRDYNLSLSGLMDPNGGPIGYMIVLRDITERKGAEQAFHRQFEELRVLHSLASACVETTEEDELIERVTQIVGEALFPDDFGILLVDQKSGLLHFHPSYRGLPAELKEKPIPPGAGITNQVVSSGTPRNVPDVTHDPGYYQLTNLGGSELCAPVKIGERVIGVINAQSEQKQAFTVADEQLLVTIAGQVATALDRIRASQQERRWTEKLAILYRASQEVVSSLDQEEIYAATHRAVAQLMPMDVFLIGLLDAEQESVYPAYFMDASGPVSAPHIPVGQGLSGHVVANGQVVRIDDLETFYDFKPVSVGPLYVRSLLAVPLRLGSKILGLLSAQCYQPQVYTPEDEQALSTLANQVAIALENALLFAEAKQRTSQLEALNNIIANVSAAPDMPELLHHAIEQLCPAISAEVGWITLWEQHAACGVAAGQETALERASQSLRRSLRQTLTVADWHSAPVPRELEAVSEFMQQAGLAGLIAVPIQAEGAPIGAIVLSTSQPRTWSAEVVVLLEAVGRQLSVAAERLGLLESIQSRLQEVTLLNNVIYLTASAKDLNAALQEICSEVGRYFNSPQVGMAFLQGDGEHAEVIAEYSLAERPSALGTLIPVTNNPSMAYILEHKRPLPVNDAQNDPLMAPVHELMRQREVASILLVPILVGDEVVGTLGIDHLKPYVFNQTAIDLVQNIARQVAQALERLRLHSSTEEYAGRLAYLAELSGYLNQPFTVAEVLEGVGKGALALGSADRAAIYVRQEGDTAACPWYVGLSDEYVAQVTRRAREMPGGQLFQYTDPVLIPDVDRLPDGVPLKSLAKMEGFKAVGLWPMIYEGQVVASAGCYYDHPHQWAESEKKVMLAFARQSAVAFQNAHLFEEARRRAQHAEALNAVISEAATLMSMPSLLEKSIDVVMAALIIDSGAAWMEAHQAIRSLPCELDEMLQDAGWAAGETLVVSDCEALPGDAPGGSLGQALLEHGVRAALLVPVISAGAPIGGIALLQRSPRLWLAEEVALVQAVSRQLHGALERLDLLAKIQQQAHQMQQLMDTVPEGVVLLDRDQRALLANPAARQHLAELLDDAEFSESQGMQGRITHLAGKPIEALFNRTESWIDIVTQGPPRRIYEVAAQSLAEGDHRGGWVLVLRDVTQERDSQLRIQMQERLATVGQLAAGIAHDFNNIMAAIVVYTDLLLIEPNLSQSSQERLSIIQKQVQRASSLIRQILDFSRRSVMEHSTLDLLPFIKELDKMLGRVLPETIRMELTYQPGSYMVNADPTRLQQVFMNLALNARDAMPHGGVLHFSLEHLDLGATDQPPLPDLSPGHWIRIKVSDSGYGISPEVMPHIFEPFFTTKPVGQGTGLGLAQVYGIIKQHGGSIDVRSQNGEGATFTIYLAALDVPDEDGLIPGMSGKSYLGLGETILLVEDDRATRDAIQALLQAQNYHTILASNGLEAAKLYDQVGRAISLVVTDIVMPGMGGVELYNALKGRDPGVKVLFITGHPLDQERQAVLEDGQVQWMQKPFSLQELSRAVRRLLDGA